MPRWLPCAANHVGNSSSGESSKGPRSQVPSSPFDARHVEVPVAVSRGSCSPVSAPRRCEDKDGGSKRAKSPRRRWGIREKQLPSGTVCDILCTPWHSSLRVLLHSVEPRHPSDCFVSNRGSKRAERCTRTRKRRLSASHVRGEAKGAAEASPKRQDEKLPMQETRKTSF